MTRIVGLHKRSCKTTRITKNIKKVHVDNKNIITITKNIERTMFTHSISGHCKHFHTSYIKHNNVRVTFNKIKYI